MDYKFCLRCGGQLKEKVIDNHRRLQCTACGFIFYLNSKPTAAAIISDGSKILLGKRGIEPFKGWWDIPGGFLELGEHPEDGVRREIKEELGVEIDIDRLVGMIMDTYETTGDKTLNIFYAARLRPGIITPGDDLVAYQWFNIDALPENIAFANAREALSLWSKSL